MKQIRQNFPSIVNFKKYKNQIKAEEKKGIEVKNLKVEEDSIQIKLPLGVYPVIGALNSIDSSYRKPNFNLIFGSEYLKLLDETKYNEINGKIVEPTIEEKDESAQWISNIDKHILSHFHTGISLYSISKYDFSNEDLSEYYDPSNMSRFFKESMLKANTNFVDTIVSFLLAINRGMYLPLTNIQFSAFLPHFYGYDRLYESVYIYSSSEKNKLKRLYDTSIDFANKKSPNITCKNFIDYFLRDSIINFESLKLDPGKEILKAFQTQPQIPLLIGQRKEILSRFIENGMPNEKYYSFLNSPDGQVEAKNKVYRIL